MNPDMLDKLLVFVGLMTTVGAITKIVLTLAGRRGLPNPDARTLDQMAERLTRIETNTEAIALEVERIGEAQRFTTRLLSDKGVKGLP